MPTPPPTTMQRYSGAEAVHLETDDPAVADAAWREIKKSTVMRAVDMKLMREPVAEVLRRAPEAAVTLADKRLRQAAADAEAAAELAGGAGGGGEYEAVAMCFGPSWRNAKEVLLVTCRWGGVGRAGDLHAALTAAQEKAARRLVQTYWQRYFSLLSADGLAWLSRTSTSRSYALHILASTPLPGWTPTADAPHAFTPKQALAAMHVTIGPAAPPPSPALDALPPVVGLLYAAPVAVATP